MKGIIGAIIVAFAIIIGAGIIAGALTFPEAFSTLVSILKWIAILILTSIGLIFLGIMILAVIALLETR